MLRRMNSARIGTLKSRHHRFRGFSLLEMTIVLVIVSLIVGTGLSGWTAYLERTRRETTIKRLDQVKTAIESYRTTNGRYPCPASFTVVGNNANYGRETDCSAAVAAGVTSIASDTVRRGKIPFRTLNLPYDATLDGWFSQMTYIVTKDLAITANYGAGTGVIELYDGATPTSNPVTTPADQVAYLLISHGPNRKGAIPGTGTTVGVGCSGTGLDLTNCGATIRFNAATLNEGQNAGAAYFDDYLAWSMKGGAAPAPSGGGGGSTGGFNVYDGDDRLLGSFLGVAVGYHYMNEVNGVYGSQISYAQNGTNEIKSAISPGRFPSTSEVFYSTTNCTGQGWLSSKNAGHIAPHCSTNDCPLFDANGFSLDRWYYAPNGGTNCWLHNDAAVPVMKSRRGIGLVSGQYVGRCTAISPSPTNNSGEPFNFYFNGYYACHAVKAAHPIASFVCGLNKYCKVGP